MNILNQGSCVISSSTQHGGSFLQQLWTPALSQLAWIIHNTSWWGTCAYNTLQHKEHLLNDTRATNGARAWSLGTCKFLDNGSQDPNNDTFTAVGLIKINLGDQLSVESVLETVLDDSQTPKCFFWFSSWLQRAQLPPYGCNEDPSLQTSYD